MWGGLKLTPNRIRTGARTGRPSPQKKTIKKYCVPEQNTRVPFGCALISLGVPLISLGVPLVSLGFPLISFGFPLISLGVPMIP